MKQAQSTINFLFSLTMLSTLALGINVPVKASEFSSKLDISTRFDARHEKQPRYQYRVRWYPKYQFSNDKWSLNGFAVTGDEFASSHNTFNGKSSQHFHLRRLYLKHEDNSGKTELGVLPTFKGRVSSTGLSKDGWISGIRHVRNLSDKMKIEAVIGELAHIDDPALQSIHSLDYMELELTTQLSPQWSYEIGYERMFNASFLKGEVKFSPTNTNSEYTLELINNLDTQQNKIVLSTSQEFTLWNQPIELFSYYSYVNEQFGTRAELTEDFVDFGHAFTLEVESPLISSWSMDWFSKLEFNQGQSRFQLGVKLKI